MTKAARHARMIRRLVATGVSATLALILLAAWYLHGHTIAVLQPAGTIASGERHMLIEATLLMLLVVIPVFVIAGTVAWRYRETNPHSAKRYQPDAREHRWLEVAWWFIPGLLILVIATITWRGTFKYDPYRPLDSSARPLNVQVVALDWRWLFIYPEQKVASVNRLYIPVNRPVTFDITADAPMNSFWIPQLAGQIYAMPGMNTQLHVMATKTGSFYGSSANISGKGFSDMHFITESTSEQSFDDWVKAASKAPALTQTAYNQLAAPKSDTAVLTYSRPANGLYTGIINKYMDMSHMEHAE